MEQRETGLKIHLLFSGTTFLPDAELMRDNGDQYDYPPSDFDGGNVTRVKYTTGTHHTPFGEPSEPNSSTIFRRSLARK